MFFVARARPLFKTSGILMGRLSGSGLIRPCHICLAKASSFLSGPANGYLSDPSRYMGTFHSSKFDDLIPLNSLRGLQLMNSCTSELAVGASGISESIVNPRLNTFVSLFSNLTTQEQPWSCGLATLVTTLNSLGIDPDRIWKHPWRWFDEQMLLTCSDATYPKHFGTTMEVFNLLADCNGADVTMIHGTGISLDEFRSIVHSSLNERDGRLVVSFSRTALGQTGLGHFSPVALYNEKEDKVLILDVARFKYAPYWVDLKDLHEAMRERDESTGKSRGLFVLRKKHSFSHSCDREVPGGKSSLASARAEQDSRSDSNLVSLLPSSEEHLVAEANAFCHELRRKMVKSLEFRPCESDDACCCSQETGVDEDPRSIYHTLNLQRTADVELFSQVSQTISQLSGNDLVSKVSKVSEGREAANVAQVFGRAFPLIASEVACLFLSERRDK